MKLYTLFTVVAVSISLNASAQIQPGSNVIGGSASFGYLNRTKVSPDEDQMSFRINPSYGRFISDKWQLSVTGTYRYSSSLITYQNSDNYFKGTVNTFGGSLGATRFFEITDKLYFHLGGQLSYEYSLGKQESYFIDYQKSDYASSDASISIRPGFSYFPNKKLMIFANIGALNYSMQTNLTVFQVDHRVNFSLNSNSISIGAGFVFGGKD